MIAWLARLWCARFWRTRLWGDRRAAAAAEFALIGPVVLLGFAGSLDLGLMFRAYNTVDRMAVQYAVSYADCASANPASPTCASEISQYSSSYTLQNFAPQINPSGVTLQMFYVTVTGTTVTPTTAYPTGTTLTAAQNSAALASISSGQTGVVVTVSYPYTMLFFQSILAALLGNNLTIAYTVAQLSS